MSNSYSHQSTLYWIEEIFGSGDITSEYIDSILQSTRRNTGLIISMNIITIEDCVRVVRLSHMEVQSRCIGVPSWIALSVKCTFGSGW